VADSAPTGSATTARIKPLLVWCKRCWAVAFWTAVTCQLFGHHALDLIPGRWKALLADAGIPGSAVVLVILIVYLIAFGGASLFRLAVYTATFPLWSPFYVVYYLAQFFRRPAALIWRAVSSIYGSGWTVVSLPFILPYLAILVVSTRSRPLLMLGILVILFAISVVLITSFSWVLAPTRIFVNLGDRALRWLAKNWERTVFQDLSPEKGVSGKRISKANEEVETSVQVCDWVDRVARVLLTPKMAVLSFLIVFLACLVLVTAAFGYVYLAAWKLDPTTFSVSGASISPNTWGAVFFSVTTITTVGVSPLMPRTWLGQAFVTLQLFCGISFLSLLALSFSTLHQSDLEAAQATWRETREYLIGRTTEWSSVLDLLQKMLTTFGPEPLVAEVEKLDEWDKETPARNWSVAIAALTKADALLKQLELRPLYDDQIPEMVLLNKGRQLLRQGKTKEAIELVRASVEMGERSPANAPGKRTFDCFLIWLHSAFCLNEPEDAEKIASLLRKERDEYYKGLQTGQSDNA